MPIPDFIEAPPNPVAGRALTALGEAFRERAGALLAGVVHAYTQPLVDTDEAVAATERGWAAIFDLESTPQPAWLGNATGTRVPPYLSVEEQRDYIRDRPGSRRGTPASLLAAVRSVYPHGRVDITERDGSPWRISVRIYEGESTPEQQRALAMALEEQRPTGTILNLVTASGASYDHLQAEHGPTFDDLAAEFSTLDAMKQHIPEEGTTP